MNSRFLNVCCIVAILLCLAISYWANERQRGVELEIEKSKKRLYELEIAHNLTIEELKMRTDPAFVDYSLRHWYEEQLKNNFDQVRGVDGKLSKDR